MRESVPENLSRLKEGLSKLGARYYALGWLYGSAGNLSARSPEGMLITASQKHKGFLGPDDFVTLSPEASAKEIKAKKASAESAIHLAVYEHFREAQVVLHVHSPYATLLTPWAWHASQKPENSAETRPHGTELIFSDYEMLKGWGIMKKGEKAILPVFENHDDVGSIADDIHAYYHLQLKSSENAALAPALLISQHGLTAWGKDFHSAACHLEIAEFLCQIEHLKVSTHQA